MKNNNSKVTGASLLEIIFACVILALAIIPIYRALSTTAESEIETTKIAPETGPSHMDNWLTCLRSRQRPNADIQFGHQHAVATIMAATALQTGRRQNYDPAKRIISA